MTTSQPHIVALDVDGTLVTFDGELFEPVRTAVAQAKAAGHHLVVSTGRALAGTTAILDRLDLTDTYVVTSNGAVVSRGKGNGAIENLLTVTFDSTAVVDLVWQHLPTAAFAVELADSSYLVHGNFEEGELQGPVEHVASVDELRGQVVTRLSVRGTMGDRERFLQAGQAIGIEGVTFAVGGTMWLDLGPEGVSKASGLEVVRAELGVSRAHIWAIGDGSNDVEMLRYASRGFAMGNAGANVVAAADDQVGDVNNCGVVELFAALLNSE